ncbi:hypothetical protein ACFRAE_17400 [Sphingobacterium sp. HJSM2_6]|uniref:hypothetical protein n=1 Tax=Sphingobacterium sp. HJSM2_6 TaxID=3366264 RepID=UPI003BD9EB1B
MSTYKLIKTYDANGDMRKQWFVQYHCLIPEELRKPEGKLYERFRVFNSINSIHNKKERQNQLNIVKSAIRELLEAGFKPFKKCSYSENSFHEKYNVCRCIDEYLEFSKSTLKKNTYGPYEDRLNLLKYI